MLNGSTSWLSTFATVPLPTQGSTRVCKIRCMMCDQPKIAQVIAGVCGELCMTYPTQ